MYDPADRAHSLQSLERPGEAIAEAFGHHVANLVWNAGQTGGKFVYYKEIAVPYPGIPSIDLTFRPPYAVDSGAAYNWRDTHCTSGTNYETTTTEWDWMSMLWALHHATNGTQFDDLVGVFQAACSGGRCDDESMDFEKFESGAASYYGNPSARLTTVRDLGIAHGVD